MATKKVRVLVDATIDGVPYKSGQVVELDAETAKPYLKDGVLDDAAAAVKWALTEGGAKLMQHRPPAAAEPAPAGDGAEPPAE